MLSRYAVAIIILLSMVLLPSAQAQNAAPSGQQQASAAQGSPAANGANAQPGSPSQPKALPNQGQLASASEANSGSVATPAAASTSAAPQAEPDEDQPLQFRLGSAYFTPIGFMDMTSVTRSENTGTGIGTNFGSIPFANTEAGSLTESRFSIQNSRIGLRVDALVKGAHVMGYWESDFLGQIGTSSNSPNGGIAVTSSSFPLRLRLYWVDIRKSQWEFLAGQSWSLMTPNRRGLSPLPSDVFYSLDMDTNYQLGLVWQRVPGFRLVYHPSDTVAFGVALENSEPYIGGGNGGGAAVLPSALSSLAGAQLNNGGSGITAPALFPNVVAKLAIDPTPRFHLELAGVEIANKIADPASVPAFQTNTTISGGGAVNLNFDVVKNLRFFLNNFYSDGAGQYIFGQAPNFIVRANGTISPVHSGSILPGIEAAIGNTTLYAYYGNVFVGRDSTIDANGSLVGYGYTGSSNGQNRDEWEATIGTITTFWKDARYGALSLITQYSYLHREPWYVASGAPSSAFINMGFVDIRYTLPGTAPTLK